MLSAARRNRLVLARAGMAIAVFAIVIAATFLRQTAIPKAHTMWAEDGKVFAQCAYDRAPLDCLLAPYEGYLHTVPRLGALVAPLGEPESLPFRLTLVAGLVAAAAAVLAALAVAGATSSSAAGLLAGTSLALVYHAGTEVSGNLTNLHWILLAASVVVVTCSWLGRPPRVPDLVLLAATGLTSPFGLLLVPLALVAVVRRTPRAGLMLAVVLGASVLQLGVMLASARRPIGRPPLTAWQVLEGTWDLILRQGWFGPRHRLWNLAVPVVAGALLLGLALVRGETRGWSARLVPLAAAIAVPLSGMVVFAASIIVNRTAYPVRYGYEPAALIAAGIALAAGLLAARVAGRRPLGRLRPRALADVGAGSLLLAVIVVGFGLGFASTFQVVARASRGPDAVAEIRALAPECRSGADSIHVLITPRYKDRWYVDIPCREFAEAP